MTKQEDIREEIAKGAYLWKNLIVDGVDSIQSFDSLTDEEQKPYYILAYQLTTTLASLGVVLILDEKLPSVFDLEDNVISALDYKKKLKGYVKVESFK